MKKEITQKNLREAFSYDAATGLFTWKKRVGGKGVDPRGIATWNLRQAGRSPSIDPNGNRPRITLFDHKINVARAVWIWFNGDLRKGDAIYTLNGDPFDVRVSNLVKKTMKSKGPPDTEEVVTGDDSNSWLVCALGLQDSRRIKRLTTIKPGAIVNYAVPPSVRRVGALSSRG